MRHPDAAPDRPSPLRLAIARILFACGLTLCLLLLGAAIALAAPPPVGSDDWNVMHPYKEWVTSQHDGLGRWCCDIGDGRPVKAEIRGDSWWVRIDPRQWRDQPGPVAGPQPTPLAAEWLQVPDEEITRNSNPTGVPILWLYQGRVQCFAPPDGA